MLSYYFLEVTGRNTYGVNPDLTFNIQHLTFI